MQQKGSSTGGTVRCKYLEIYVWDKVHGSYDLLTLTMTLLVLQHVLVTLESIKHQRRCSSPS